MHRHATADGSGTGALVAQVAGNALDVEVIEGGVIALRAVQNRTA
jgi:hypothetical protein